MGEMKTQPLVSILIISFNQEQFVGEALAGALEQDYENLEVVIADDGSTDGTTEVILKFAEKYPDRLVPLTGGPNLGITGNSNRALRACKGKYIAFQGGDDVMLPGKVKSQVEWLEVDEKRVLCGHGVEVVRPDGYVEILKTESKNCTGRGYLDFIKAGTSIFKTVSIMVRASEIPLYGFDERVPFVSDWKLWVDCLGKEGLYGCVDGIFATYRLHNNNITTTRSIDCIQDGIQIMQMLVAENNDKHAERILIRNIASRYLFLALSQVREKKMILGVKSAFKGFSLDPHNFSVSLLRIFYNKIERLFRKNG